MLFTCVFFNINLNCLIGWPLFHGPLFQIQNFLGEYDVQTGFGWTNGVIIDFMVIFGDDLLSDEEDVELMEGKYIFLNLPML